jgi:hypothetical protein
MAVKEAEACLSALASDTLAELEVSSEGRILYRFDKRFRSALRRKSLRSKLRPVLIKVWNTLKAASRFAFGLTLFSSILITLVAITAVLSSRNSDSRNDRRGGGGGFISFYSLDPYLFIPGRSRRCDEDADEMNFLQAVFSFVFGDEEEISFESQRWKALGEMIASKGGVVCEEELRPFLMPEGGSSAPLHSLVAPALTRLKGEAVLDEKEGTLLFTFPQLTAKSQAKDKAKSESNRVDYFRRRPPPKPTPTREAVRLVEEPQKVFSKASPEQLLGVIALAAVNVGAVAFLNSLVSDPVTLVSLAKKGLLGVLNLLPFLNAYAAFFVTVPAIRWVINAFKNKAVDARNEIRQESFEEAFIRPSKELSLRLKAARAQAALGSTRAPSEVAFSTSGLDQSYNDEKARAWEEKLSSK